MDLAFDLPSEQNKCDEEAKCDEHEPRQDPQDRHEDGVDLASVKR